jgi:hypothetical protein
MLIILGPVAFFSGFIISTDRQITVEALEHATYPPSASAGLTGEVFAEQGLPNGTVWSITITSGLNNTSITHESNNFLIVFWLPITSTPYTWHLNPVRGYTCDLNEASFLVGGANSTVFGYNNVSLLWSLYFYSNNSINNSRNIQISIILGVMILLALVVSGTLLLIHFGYMNEYSRKRD